MPHGRKVWDIRSKSVHVFVKVEKKNKIIKMGVKILMVHDLISNYKGNVYEALPAQRFHAGRFKGGPCRFIRAIRKIP